MKKTLLAKLLCFALALIMLVGCLAACGEPAPQVPGEGDGSGGNTNGGTSNGGDNSNLTGEEADYLPAAKNYGNRIFRIAAAQHQAWGLVHYDYLDGVDVGDGKAVNDALQERSLLLSDLHGVVIELDTTRSAGQLYTYLNSQYTANKDFADQMFFNGMSTMASAKKGQLVNLLLLEPLNLEASYYDQSIQQDYRINNMLFQMSGDFDTIDELVTFGVLYNDKLYEEAGYYETEGSPYTMVENYKWTYTKMLELAAPITVNEDQKFDINDTVGIVSEDQAGYYFFLGSGLRPMTNKNGSLSINLNDGTYYGDISNVLSAVSAICTSPAFCIPYRDFDQSIPAADRGSGANKEMFIGDQALFRTSSLSTTLNGMPEMTSDFGILPIPMYQESQQKYYCSLNDDANHPLVIPRTVKDPTTVAEITEIISYYSRYGGDETLYEAFFERLTIAKICRKEEDRQMLELIFSSKVFDVDRMLNLIGMHGKVSSYVAAKCGSDIDSTLNGALGAANSSLQTYLTQFEKANKGNY